MNEEFVSIGKAAKYLGMSIDGLRKWETDTASGLNENRRGLQKMEKS
jgi:DNA-binding transcriptional regulator YiaG